MKRPVLLAIRFGLTGALLGVAVLLIDFTDHAIVRTRAGEKVVGLSAARTQDEVRVTLKDHTVRTMRAADVEAIEERPGLASVLGRATPWPALLVVPALLLLFTFQAMRWRLLLKANGFDVPLGRLFRVTWAGAFFNQILPGSVGGDVAKALIVAQGEGRKASVFGTVLLDRLVGLGTVIFIAGLAVVPVIGRAELRPIVWFIAALIGGGLLGAAVYFNPLIRSWPAAKRLKDKLPLRRALEEVDEVLKTMHHAPRTVLAAVVLSAAGQAATILGIYALAVSLGSIVPVGNFFLVEPIIFLLSAVPISVGGWGVEQVAYAQLFGMAGMAVNTAIALSVLYKLSTLAVSLPGGILFVAGATRAKAPEAVRP